MYPTYFSSISCSRYVGAYSLYSLQIQHKNGAPWVLLTKTFDAISLKLNKSAKSFLIRSGNLTNRMWQLCILDQTGLESSLGQGHASGATA